MAVREALTPLRSTARRRERRLRWTLNIARTLAFCLALSPARGAENDDLTSVPAAPRRAPMDYGSLLTYTVGTAATPSVRTNSNLALKGVCVRLGASNEAAICFDTDLLRYYAGWTGNFLDISRTHLTSYKGSFHALVGGELKFGTRLGPGWSQGNDFDDPRAIAAGPLPAGRGRFKGIVRHGERVIFHYEVAGTEIWETPEFVATNGNGFFVRTFHLDHSASPLSVKLCDADFAPQRASSAETGKWAVLIGRTSALWSALGQQSPASGLRLEATPTGRLQLNIPIITQPVDFAVLIWADARSAVLTADSDAPTGRPVEPLQPFLRGGPPRWPQTLTTRGRLGAPAGYPYVVDTVTLPETNPWNSWMRLTAFDFFKDGRAAVATWNGDIWIVSGLDDTLGTVSWKRYAAGLFEPLGLKIVNDEIFVLCRDQLMRLRDLNADGEADEYECFNNETWPGVSYHAFAFDLQTDRAGNFYYIRCGQRVDPELPLSGAMVKVAPDGSHAELFASGLRAANGMAVGPNDEITCADNQGNWTPSSRINWMRRGGFYGYVPHAHRTPPPTDFDPPLCWLPMSIDNSSGGQVWVTSERWGPLAGQLLHTSYGKASLFLVLVDEVDGQKQGGVVAFPLKFDSGIHRARFHPRDGQLWVCGLKGWQTSGARDGALQRVRYLGGPVRMPSALHVTPAGLQITFTVPLEETSAVDEQNYAVEQWNYAWTEKYGSPDFSVAHPGEPGRDPVAIKTVKLSADRRTVSLELAALRPVMQMRVQFRLKGADGTPIGQTIYATINRVPGGVH